MFKFDEYPEIKKAYREHNRLKRIFNKAEKKYVLKMKKVEYLQMKQLKI